MRAKKKKKTTKKNSLKPKQSKSSAWEDTRYLDLVMLQKAGVIGRLFRQPPIPLITGKDIVLCVYTADFFYEVLKKFKQGKYSFVPGELVIEEYKGSKYMHAYTRENYKVFRRWVITDYPQFTFIENIAGDFKKPRVLYKNSEKAKEFITDYYPAS